MESKYNIVICSLIKDEHLFLDEWLQWHLNLGFEKIYLFEDVNSKSHKSIADKYSNVVLIPLSTLNLKIINNTEK